MTALDQEECLVTTTERAIADQILSGSNVTRYNVTILFNLTDPIRQCETIFRLQGKISVKISVIKWLTWCICYREDQGSIPVLKFEVLRKSVKKCRERNKFLKWVTNSATRLDGCWSYWWYYFVQKYPTYLVTSWAVLKHIILWILLRQF